MALDQPTVAFVWVWLPGHTAPVVAGRLDDLGPTTSFTYGVSYRERDDAMPLYSPELPLREGPQMPEYLTIAGCIADAGPDAWGRRVVDRRRNLSTDDRDLNEITYLLESASNRTGALDFQASPDQYHARDDAPVTLDLLMRAADAVEAGVPLAEDLDAALLHETSMGGAQPKAALDDGTRQLVAKFSSRTDVLPNVKLEYVAMTLAREAGLNVAPVEITNVLGKDVLLIERFDRPGDGTRRSVVSARTMLRVGETGIGSSYSDLADIARQRFTDPEATVRELFSRLTFNILVGNTDDHARNHAAFWDGDELTITPAYDIVPQRRRGEEADQAMAIGPDGSRASQLVGCVDRAGSYQLTRGEARAIIDHQISVLHECWDAVCEQARLTKAERRQYWGRQFLNPYAMRGH